MKLIYLPSTEHDFAWFHHYYTSVFPEGAIKALQQFDIAAEMLSANPYIGKETHGDTRELVISQTPFSYLYRITEQHIEIIRIWDNRQDSLV